MAQTYNIYLRKRLTEFDLIIRNLPYRDGLVIYNRMYLDAMVNYLYLQKFIVGDTDTKLVSEIDNLLERVFNIFSSGMELCAELELFAAKPTGGSTELVLTTGKANIGEESFNTFQNVTQLLTNTLKYDIAKSLGSGSTEMELRTAPASTLKEALEKFKNTMLLDSDASTSAITHGEAETDMVLTTNDFDIFYMLSVEGEAMMNLLFSADFEMWYTLGTGDSSMCLTVENIPAKGLIDTSDFVVQVIESQNGEAIIQNEPTGGGAKFHHTDGTESFVGVNDGGENGMVAQIYADKNVDGNWIGSRINVYQKGIFYHNAEDKASADYVADDPEHEIATIGDIPDVSGVQEVIDSMPDEILSEIVNVQRTETTNTAEIRIFTKQEDGTYSPNVQHGVLTLIGAGSGPDGKSAAGLMTLADKQKLDSIDPEKIESISESLEWGTM